MNKIFYSQYKNILFISLLIYLITAIFSVGFYHYDEHFQILEFINYKLGKSPLSDLPWEYYAKIRPSLLPAIGIGLIKAMNLVGIHNPFTYTLVFRIITAMLSWLITVCFCSLLINDFSSDKTKKIFVYLSLFLWFVPFISVRFSSECYAAITFLSALYLIIRFYKYESDKNPRLLILAGLLLGFSFFFRFQIAFSIIGLASWLVFIKKMQLKYILVLIVSAAVAIAFCMYLDYRFYGEFVFTPVNYYIANIIENKAANWGTDPWWSYFRYFTLSAVPPISILLLVFFFIGVYKGHKSIFTWCIIPFIIGHSIIGHKELRFLFPMVFCFIYITAIGIEYSLNRIKYKGILRFTSVFLIVVNCVLLSFMMIAPAKEEVRCYKFLYDYSSGKEIVLLCSRKDIYDLAELRVNFYKSPTVKCIVLKDDNEVSDYLKTNNFDSIFVLERTFSINKSYSGYESKTIYSSYPAWITHLNFNNWLSRAGMLEINELKKKLLPRDIVNQKDY